MKKTNLIIVSIILFFVSCTSTKNLYRNYYPYPITKRPYTESKYPISIDPNDTVSINKYSIIGNFTIIEIIEKNKVYYDIIVQRDSVDTVSDSKNNVKNFYRIISLKTKNIRLSKKIKEKQLYTLTLIPCFVPEPNIVHGHMYVNIYTKGLRIPIVKCEPNIYTTPNLNGLYYTKPKRAVKKERSSK